jgi:hypothetical protein
VRGAKLSSQISVAFKNSVGEKIGIDLYQQLSKIVLARCGIRKPLHILGHFSIDKNVSCNFMPLNQWMNETHG